MNIKIPQVIQIGSHKYSIQFREWDMRDGGYYSRVNHRRQVIEIDPTRPASQRIYALIHEVGHIINNVYLDGELDEKQINGIAGGYAQLLSGFNVELDWSDIPNVGE